MEQLSSTEVAEAQGLLRRVEAVIDQRLVGQAGLRTCLMAALMAGGHILIESVPGLAKTTAAQALASAISGTFHRIQCTPDLMPSDIIGTQIYNQTTGQFTTQLGPVHANVVLLDEVNRSSAKTQAAMLEAMQERQTSIGTKIYPLPSPFLVLATQNPIEEEGTYVLPEAQMDRFLLKEVITYPTPPEEDQILSRTLDGSLAAPIAGNPIALDDVARLQALTARVYVAEPLRKYVVAVMNATRGIGSVRPSELVDQVRVGASPRGAIALVRAAQALALMRGREYVTPDEIKDMRYPVLRHRLLRTYDAVAAGVTPESLIDAVFAAVPTP
ncbi:MAG: AAA family ATPase [Bifidobacteriaceae bacterium]|nr:AAA family ATPase [Bifidobacteriaceae bacterium]